MDEIICLLNEYDGNHFDLMTILLLYNVYLYSLHTYLDYILLKIKDFINGLNVVFFIVF